MNSLGLYIHIPFCKSKCIYCDFYSLAGHASQMDAYTDALCTHLTRTAFRAAAYLVDSVYFGGGTPSYLGSERLLKIWNAIQAHYTLSPNAEITLETNPDSAAFELLHTLHDAGFNRLSLGMQSAQNHELQRIGRVHTFEQVRDAVQNARRAGFDNLSLDLIYGLPRQTFTGWQSNIHAAVSLRPEHLSCYGLKVEPGTPLWLERESAGLPDDEQQADAYLWAVDALKSYGYRQYEISNFAYPGRESRHNLKYWTLGEYLGFGPGAHSDFNGERFAWSRDINNYISGIASDTPHISGVASDTPHISGIASDTPHISGVASDTPHISGIVSDTSHISGVASGILTESERVQIPESDCTKIPMSERTKITPSERVREWLMLSLRTSNGIHPEEYQRRSGRSFKPFTAFAEQCIQAGYAHWNNGSFALTPRGFLVSNQIIGQFLELSESD